MSSPSLLQRDPEVARPPRILPDDWGPRTVDVTVIIPAYNEAETIAETVDSILRQTVRVRHVIVVDDGSSDDTGARARSLGVTVLRPDANTGSKAGAQNAALVHVDTEFTLAVDADTTLEDDAIERLLAAVDSPNVASACGFVVPRRIRSTWERGRYVEYLFGFGFYKRTQDFYRRPLISSGCFSLYRTRDLMSAGGWQTRTLTEDVDLTWTFYEAGRDVRFVSDAVCYPIEPSSYRLMCTQLRRWAHGFVQNVRLHWRGTRSTPMLRLMVAIWFLEAATASIAYLFVVPVLAFVFREPALLLLYVLDAPLILVPVVVEAWPRREVGKALASFPAFWVTRLLGSVFTLRALWSELVCNRSFRVYETGP
ncbi:MAG: glycosyltransferase [Acidimicrobiia bacterium]|nr:glycosyltransferase [Acidimicrobiia bacterium]